MNSELFRKLVVYGCGFLQKMNYASQIRSSSESAYRLLFECTRERDGAFGFEDVNRLEFLNLQAISLTRTTVTGTGPTTDFISLCLFPFLKMCATKVAVCSVQVDYQHNRANCNVTT